MPPGMNWPPTLTKENVRLFWKSKSVCNLNFDEVFVKLYDNTAVRIEKLTSKQKYPFPDNNLEWATFDQIPFE